VSYLEAILLGLLQALTEFLPVSSSGHLVLAQAWFGEHDVDVLFNVLLHTATMAAVIVYFRREILELVCGLAGRSGRTPPFAGYERRAVGLIALSNVPTGVIGLFVERYLEDAVSTPFFVGLMLLVTGCLLWVGRGRASTRAIADMTAADALLIGVAQGVAVLPGLSRAGVTIVVAILLGMERTLAAKFSLLISIPAIAGATLLQALDADTSALAVGPYLGGMVLAGVVGYGAIHLIIALVREQGFFRFAYYVWPLGAVAIATGLY
jgi:undecaprenyl-diphosphatase